MIDIYNIAHKIKPFINENELPVNQEIVIEYMDENEKFFTLTGKVEIYNNERFFITKSSSLPMTFKSLDIRTWGLPLSQKEKGSRVYLDFSESELEELQELLNMTQDYIDRNDLQDWKEKEKRIKKFQEKFSKVEF